MPGWQPNWDDVAFDFGVAAHYANACRRTGAAVQRMAQERNQLASSARIDWEGPTRDRFDTDLRRWNDQAADLVDQLFAVAQQVEAAADAARAAQAQRVAERARWLAEKQLEDQVADELANELAKQMAREAAERSATVAVGGPAGS